MEKEQPDKMSRYKSINIDGTKYKTHLTTKFTSRINWEQPDENKLISYLPGNIVKIFVKKGQKVKKGDKAILFEAMKMKNRIDIHKSGTIKEVRVKEGEVVPKGIVLLEIMEKS